ncbi:gliding motility-associated C-terminal domain-containing protein [Belliella sp. DSM 107340]|uniref:Gliding motility-associated C-terminal domain-containing protein n=1 Tax=Belliella calami TaxID=2923436 RepID=A0ABS9UV86_9BACT|nr:gliding motility-associated C-terminal domain-containing protein [Belliella calami]MCH7400163.1 gliding motility-associated C-terminal domain-containing protein [Belliella calami]
MIYKKNTFGALFLVVSGFFLTTPSNNALSQTINKGDLRIKPETLVSSFFDLENQSSATFVNDGNLLLFANLKNDGSLTFSEGQNGVLRFVGNNGVQQISGSQISYLNNVIFQNPQPGFAFQLFGELSISGVSSFVQGIVLTEENEGLIVFENGSSHEQTSDLSYVNGPVTKIGDEIFNFPIGDGNYFRFAGISSPAEINSNFNAQYFLQDPDELYPRDQKEQGINLINDAEYWEVFKETTTSDVRLTLSWSNVTTPAFVLGNENQIVIAKWDSEDNQWISLGGDRDPNAQVVTTPIDLEAYGVFTLAVLANNLTDLSIEKTSFQVSVFEGDIFDYEIKVQNNSQTTANDVVVVDNLPNGVVFESMELESAFGIAEFDFETNGQTLIWRIPSFIAGDELTINLKVKANNQGVIVNHVAVSSLEEDQNLLDNEDTDENRVNEFFIPNVITPNSDGSNDTFIINGLNRFDSNHLTIFNRWGDHVFETDNYQQDWDANGRSAGTYFYILKVTESNGQNKEFKGWIQVIK